MQKIFISSLIALFMLPALQAQTQRVAMLEPLGNVSPMQKAIIRAKLAEALTNSGVYEALTRTDIDQLMNEFNFQHGGMVNDEQRQRLGQISGAELMCITQLTSEGNYFFAEIRLVDLQSGRIVRTANQLMASTPITALENGSIELANKLIGEDNTALPTDAPIQPRRPAVETLSFDGMLVADGRKVYQNGNQLNKNEVRRIMRGTDALRLYNKGISRNRNGNILLTAGVCFAASSGYILAVQPFEKKRYFTFDGNLYYDYENRLNNAIGVSFAAAGAVMMVAGITLKMTAKNPVKNSIIMYNSENNRANMELKFNVTGNGVRLAILF